MEIHIAVGQISFQSPPKILGVFSTPEKAARRVHQRFCEPLEERIAEMMNLDIWNNYKERVVGGETLVTSFVDRETGGAAWVETHTLDAD